MGDVYIAGIGLTPVREHWDQSLANLSTRAILNALKDAGGVKPQAFYVGNLLASTVSRQTNLGTLLVYNAGLEYLETFTAEAGEASGAAAFRMGVLAVLSGYVNAAMVVAVEKATDMVGPMLDDRIAQVMDYDFEAVSGLTPYGQAALLMRRYMDVYSVPHEAFGTLPVRAHTRAIGNPNAMFHRSITIEQYLQAPILTDPLNLYDAAPYVDGAVAIILINENIASHSQHPLVRVAGSSVATDAMALHDRPDPLAFSAARLSCHKAMDEAGLNLQEIDVFEPWDAFSIYALLSIEACGLAAPGEGSLWLKDHSEELPMLTMGGNKARGFPLGAASLYQIAEASLQLRGQAGANQVPDAHTALVQSMGGPASTVITHVLTGK